MKIFGKKVVIRNPILRYSAGATVVLLILATAIALSFVVGKFVAVDQPLDVQMAVGFGVSLLIGCIGYIMHLISGILGDLLFAPKKEKSRSEEIDISQIP